jgi:hypothetical protein
MEAIVERPAGLDVHKAQVTACVRVPGAGGEREQHVAEFPTTVRGPLALGDRLRAHAVATSSRSRQKDRRLGCGVAVPAGRGGAPAGGLRAAQADPSPSQPDPLPQGSA